MKAQGDMNAMRITCPRAALSGTKPGAMLIPEAPWPAMATAKHTVTPAVNNSTSATMMRAVARLVFAHSSPIRAMTSSVTSASPR